MPTYATKLLPIDRSTYSIQRRLDCGSFLVSVVFLSVVFLSFFVCPLFRQRYNISFLLFARDR